MASKEEKPDEGAAEGDGTEAKKAGGGSKLPIIIGVVNMVAVLGLGAMFALGGKGKEEAEKGKDAKKTPAGAAAAASGDHAAEAHGDAHGDAAEGHGEAAEGHGEEAAHAEGGPAVKTAIVGLGVFIINLAEPGEDRYLKCKIGVEVNDEGEAKKSAEGKIAKVRYEVNMLLAGLRVADVTGPEKIEQLRKVMLQRARKALAPDIKVVGIWPEEWIVQ
jgi:flagellar basal body-associated protein FliL